MSIPILLLLKPVLFLHKHYVNKIIALIANQLSICSKFINYAIRVNQHNFRIARNGVDSKN